MKREDFIFCIGYQGDAALVDGQAKKRYKNCTAQALLQDGLFKAALSSAMYDNDAKAQDEVIAAYSRAAGIDGITLEQIKRLLGVSEPSDAIEKIIVL